MSAPAFSVDADRVTGDPLVRLRISGRLTLLTPDEATALSNELTDAVDQLEGRTTKK